MFLGLCIALGCDIGKRIVLASLSLAIAIIGFIETREDLISGGILIDALIGSLFLLSCPLPVIVFIMSIIIAGRIREAIIAGLVTGVIITGIIMPVSAFPVLPIVSPLVGIIMPIVMGAIGPIIIIGGLA